MDWVSEIKKNYYISIYRKEPEYPYEHVLPPWMFMDMLPPWMRPRPRRPPPSEVYLRAMAQEDDLTDDLQGKYSLINFY